MPIRQGNAAANKITGGVGQDYIYGRAGNDTLDGGFGADFLYGEEGNDLLRGGAGSDELDGGEGDDTLIPGSNASYDGVYLSDGNDAIDFTGATGPGYDIYAGFHYYVDVDVEIGATEGSIVLRDSEGERLGRSTLRRLDAIDDEALLYIGAGPGDDSVRVTRETGVAIRYSSGGGDDVFHGSARTVEQVQGVNARQSIADGPEIYAGETRITRSVNGQMSGESRAIDGSASLKFTNVDLVLASDSHLFVGSAGADAFAPRQGAQGIDGRGGFDVVRYDTTSSLLELRVDLARGVALELYRRGNELKRYEDGIANVEGVVGSARDDAIFGNGKANRLEGRAGDDTLKGAAGADTLIGGEGDDLLDGGAGRDRFVFGAEDGADRIRGFANGQDRLEITDGASGFADLSISALGRHAVVTFAETTVTLFGTSVAALDSSDFLFS